MQLLLVTLTVLALQAGAAEAHASGAAASLARCEQTVGKEAAKFERGSVKAMESCLQAMVKAVVPKGLTPAAAAAAVAPACAREFRRLDDARGHGGTLAAKMAARIAAKDGAPGIVCSAPDSTCGSGRRDGIEDCDGPDLGGASCASLGFLGGTLACDRSCHVDTSGCLTDLCGDGVRDGIESCDGG